jgi:anti-sigma regulatory factor (Ser/Thr protein kinase)
MVEHEGCDAGSGREATWSWPATVLSIPAARREAVRYLQRAIDERRLADIALALSEALTNAVVHAHRGGAAGGELCVGVELTATDIVVSVSDDGCGMTPRADSPGLGLGLPVMAAVSDGLDIEEPPRGGTVTRLRFRRDLV